MFVIKDPDWYLKNQNQTDKIYSNIIFLILAIYYYNNNQKRLGLLFLLLFFGSTTFHIKTNNYTLLFDRITMVLVFSHFFNLFYNKISFIHFSILGIISVLYWFLTENLLFFFLYQFASLILFLLFYPMDFIKKLILITLYTSITYSQILDKGKYHTLKHLGLGILSVFIV